MSEMRPMDQRKWVQEEFADVVREHAKELLDDLDNQDFDSQVEIKKQRDRILRFLRQEANLK